MSAAIAYYRLSDGADIPLILQPVWCNTCNDLRSAERLAELARLQEVLADLESKGLSKHERETAELLQQTPESYFAERVRKWQAAVRWRLERKSQPRCLACESTNLRLLAPDIEQSLESFAHPDCGGTFTQSNSWHGSQATFQILDAEGRIYNGD